ncbi:hypothetical protein [Thioalkalivibrio sp. ALE30]|uniref:hypothetical protein n=1 Tax=Thioalkalivibrio sp. ALE30 TaxID=1158181 RepID=UPI0012DD9CDC|nr:hypothetical protein [Thioalkalivibrio sp. ALE30]
MIKAIETRYKGHRFRSRLEARWAVFFDASGIKWIYEKEGFSVNGKPYLPDFYLPEFGYFEVKGRYEYDDQLMQEFANEIREPLFVAFEEIPLPESGRGYLKTFIPQSYAPEGEMMYWGYDDMFLECDECGKISVQNAVYDTIKGNCCEGSREMSLEHALMEAREARFEHGDKPKV